MDSQVALTPSQLKEVTGFRQKRNQRVALTQMGIPFKLRPNGTPFVSIAILFDGLDREAEDNQIPSLDLAAYASLNKKGLK